MVFEVSEVFFYAHFIHIYYELYDLNQGGALFMAVFIISNIIL